MMLKSSLVIMFLLTTPFNRKLVNKCSFIGFNIFKKNIYVFNRSFLLYLSGSLQMLCLDIIYVDYVAKLGLPCLFCIYNGYIYVVFEYGKIGGFLSFLDLLRISFIVLLNCCLS